MITAVDTNIFLAVLTGDLTERTQANRALLDAGSIGPLVTSSVCYAEMTRQFRDQDELDTFFGEIDCDVIPVDRATAFLAGTFLADYRRRGGSRARILADFLVAASASLHADRLLTNDKRSFSENFPHVQAITSSEIR